MERESEKNGIVQWSSGENSHCLVFKQSRSPPATGRNDPVRCGTRCVAIGSKTFMRTETNVDTWSVMFGSENRVVFVYYDWPERVLIHFVVWVNYIRFSTA
ncbi:hypothetical protein TIFTF001_021269 [Ficus carica]|uniref:Uncharacterized protein n=1 Tax=Ficus carica TaxID=3494 RepID=A0AA88ASD6_FICCA|nr:hypothetical protein TIFTF001_021269 [Ficus carica]